MPLAHATLVGIDDATTGLCPALFSSSLNYADQRSIRLLMTYTEPVTFGKYIANARKRRQMSQKELASRIRREEDDSPISPQYLNDIERDRRNPTSDHLIQQFAKVLDVDPDYLSYLAGTFPEEIRRKNLSEEAVKQVFHAFRRPQRK